MEAVIKKWGNSPALRLPASVMQEAKLSVDQKVSVNVQRGKIVIEPVAGISYSLDELVAGITDDNQHEDTSFGKRVGKEVW